MRFAVVSDTHIPSREGYLPEWVVEAVEAADHTIHAGDFDSRTAFEEFGELTDDPTVVRGNTDPELGIPDVATVEVGQVTFVVTHGHGGPMEDYRERVARIARNHAEGPHIVGICGHTHRLMDESVDGIRLLNPGSATGADPASFASMLTVEVAGGEVDVSVLRE